MTSAEISKLLPILLPTAAFFALIGWWLRGKKKTVSASAPSAAAKTASPSNTERQRLRDLEGKLRTAEAALATTTADLTTLTKTSVPAATHAALQSELETARTSLSAQEIQLKKSRDVQTTLQNQANDAGKKIQARAIALENELSAARTEIIRLKAIADPNTDGFKRLESEIETVRTRLRAVEAQLGERNAELNALKASALSSTARAPRTIAASQAIPGAPLNLLGFEPTLSSTPSSLPPALTASTSGTASPSSTLPASALNAPVAPPAALASPVPTENLPLSTDKPESAPADTFASARAILGKRVQPDDLTVVEGIGPAINQLLITAGYANWSALAAADPAALRTILQEAGPSFATHDPETWPSQARLAAEANWFQLKSLQDKLLGGRPETAYV